MNLHELVKWGRETLALIDDPCRLEAVPFKVSMERVRAKLGWLVEFREALAEWSQWHEVNEAASAIPGRSSATHPGPPILTAAASLVPFRGEEGGRDGAWQSPK